MQQNTHLTREGHVKTHLAFSSTPVAVMRLDRVERTSCCRMCAGVRACVCVHVCVRVCALVCVCEGGRVMLTTSDAVRQGGVNLP